MKKIALITALLLASTITFAQHRERDRDRDMRPVYRDGSGWLVPSLIGGAIVYSILNQPREQPPVIVQQPIIVQQPTPQSEYSIQPVPGTVYEERIIYDRLCHCNKKFLIVVNPQQLITQ